MSVAPFVYHHKLMSTLFMSYAAGLLLIICLCVYFRFSRCTGIPGSMFFSKRPTATPAGHLWGMHVEFQDAGCWGGWTRRQTNGSTVVIDGHLGHFRIRRGNVGEPRGRGWANTIYSSTVFYNVPIHGHLTWRAELTQKHPQSARKRRRRKNSRRLLLLRRIGRIIIIIFVVII